MNSTKHNRHITKIDALIHKYTFLSVFNYKKDTCTTTTTTERRTALSFQYGFKLKTEPCRNVKPSITGYPCVQKSTNHCIYHLQNAAFIITLKRFPTHFFVIFLSQKRIKKHVYKKDQQLSFNAIRIQFQACPMPETEPSLIRLIAQKRSELLAPKGASFQY